MKKIVDFLIKTFPLSQFVRDWICNQLQIKYFLNLFFFHQGNNWITVGQYDSKSKEITLRRDPLFSGSVTGIPGKGRPTYKIAAFFPTHDDLGPLRDLGLEWQAAFRVAVELVNAGPFKVTFNYVLVDGGVDSKSCRQEAEVGE